MMKTKLRNILIPFIGMFIAYFASNSDIFLEMGVSIPHVGLLFVFGLIFGPYGSLGAVAANIVIDLLNGYFPIEILPSAIFSFGVSYLSYKLWYTSFRGHKITKPNLDNFYHVLLFLSIIIICGFIYSVVHGNLIYVLFDMDLDQYITVYYFMNFINIAFVFGIIFIWLSKKIDFVYTPEPSKRPFNKRLYQIIFCLLLLVCLISMTTLVLDIDSHIIYAELISIGILLFAFLTKPVENKVEENEENTIVTKIVNVFLTTTLLIAIIGIIISLFSYGFVESLDTGNEMNLFIYLMPLLIISDALIILFFIPGIVILKYIENKVIKPISSFSEIEKFIKEDEKIETEGLVEIYSKYINEQNEIGTLARSYTDLINHNNQYIENIHEIEGEKERIKAELDIATKIQAANLPTEALINDDYIVNGYSHPAKEVGGDFFDYYEIDDDNLAIVIGDASGKGVPAALLATITQAILQQLLKHEKDPSKVLYLLNNQLAENNSESMFITLWLGIYNKATKKLTFSNAGHNPPLIKENDEFKYLNIDTGIVLGIMEDYEFVCEELTFSKQLVAYTDGITDANNKENDMYGEDRLRDFFNGFKLDTDPIKPLLDDINDFTKGAEQFDDMTLIYLKIE